MRKPVYYWASSLVVGLLSYATFTLNHSLWDSSLLGLIVAFTLSITACFMFGCSVEMSFKEDEFTTEIDHKRISAGMWLLMSLLSVSAVTIFLIINTQHFLLALIGIIPAVIIVLKIVQKTHTMMIFLKHYRQGLPDESEMLDRLQKMYQKAGQ